MRKLTLHLDAVLCVLFVAFSQLPAAGTVISSFDNDADGWTHASGGDAGTTVSWAATGGNPGGRLVMNDSSQGAEDNFAAPATFLGNDLAAYGKQLTFDIEDDHATALFPNAVVITGDGFIITHSLAPLSANSWDHVSLTLDETGGWQFNFGGVPTTAQFQSILVDVTSLSIAGDYTDTVEVVAIDNVTLPVPEPSSIVLLLVGTLAGLRQIRVMNRRKCR